METVGIVLMLGLHIWEGTRTDRLSLCHKIVSPLCIVIILCSCRALGQVILQQPQTLKGGHGSFASQLVTPNALRAPATAEHALDKAAKAFINHDTTEAEQQLVRALAIYPDYAKALTLRGIVTMTSDPPAAITDLEHAIRVDPSYGAPYAVLAAIYNDSHQHEHALANAQKARRFLPESWPVHYEMARALFWLNRNEEALQEVNEAMRGMSGDPKVSAGGRATIHYLRGIILLNEREFSEARVELEQTMKEEPGGALAIPSSQLLAQSRSSDNR